MEMLEAIILGIVQGLTEFLPISSSGHLILMREWLGNMPENSLAIDAVLQLATAFAVIAYFWRDVTRLLHASVEWIQGVAIRSEEKILILALSFGTIPAVMVGMMLEDIMEITFRDASVVASMLIVGSILMGAGELLLRRQTHTSNLTIVRGIGIGMFQCLALIPGISRSGATISGGLLFGLSREHATRFAFLLSVPIIMGSGIKKLAELEIGHGSIDVALLVGFIASFVVGVGAIHFLVRYLKTHTLWIFIWYRLFVAVVVFWIV